MATSRILVIDDEQVVLDSVKRVLSAEDFDVDMTSNSAEGLTWGTTHDYDLVITDIRMPDIGGLTILRDIKQAQPRTAVIILTGYATVASAVQAMKLGAAEYLEKPFTPEDLLGLVRDTLSRSRAASSDPKDLLHPRTVLRVIQRACTNRQFAADVRYHGADALDDFELTEMEKLAILTGDIAWVERQIGPLSNPQRLWMENRARAEI